VHGASPLRTENIISKYEARGALEVVNTRLQSWREIRDAEFLEVTSTAENRQSAIARKKELFPGFAPEDFLLVHSVNFHVKPD
jgi:hypothetical protein